MVHLNPYKIAWSIEVKSDGKVKFDHFSDLETLKARIKPQKGSKVYWITDKQFSMIQNSWNGEEKELPKPFKHKVVCRDGNMVQVIPLTKNQFENPIYGNSNGSNPKNSKSKRDADLEHYCSSLVNAQEKQKKKEGTPYIGRVENPKGVCNTIWIPVSTGNRTATVNLNHEILGFDENGTLWGANGNCGLNYVIVKAPASWPNTFQSKELETLAEVVCEKLDKPADYPTMRVLKADNRLPVILESIKELEA